MWELIKGDNGSGLHNLIGINPSAMTKNKGLKYCPACANEDKKRVGLYYWHRIHQIPDLQLCPDHECHLITYLASAIDLRRSFYIDANEVITEIPPIQRESNERLIDLSLLMAEVMRGESTFDINTVDYGKLIESSIFQKGTKRIESTFTSAFVEYYGGELLEMVLPGIGSHWIKQIVYRPLHFFHPVRHLMMTRFLSQVQKKEKKLSLFGEGPWPCINRAADHFGRKVVTDISIHFDSKTKRQIARLSCSCGMIYTKSYLNNTSTEGTEFTRIIEWGDLWFSVLRRELTSKQSYRSIARKLGTDAKTISKYSLEAKGKQVQNVSGDKAKQIKRKKWEKLLTKFKRNKIALSRKQNPALYIWLYRHDNSWLMKTNKNNHVDQSTPKLRLNWDSLDKKVLDLVIETVAKLKEEKYRGRITKSLIAKIIQGQHYLLGKNAPKFPKSIASINSRIESRDQFHQRRISEAIQQLRETNQLKRWKVMQRAGLGKRVFPSAIKILNRELQNAS